MYSSYKSLFKIKWQIYSIGDWPLPRPIPLDSLGIFVLLCPFGILLAGPLSQLLDQPRLAVGLLLSFALTYLVTKFDPQGRPFLIFVLDLIMYLAGPKKRDFTTRAVPKKRKLVLFWDTIVLK